MLTLAHSPTAVWSLEFAIAVFVVACPCGIALAAPTALLVGSGLAAKFGILARGGGEAFQEAAQLDVIVFDKTGTLTRNEMEFRFCSIGGIAYADVVDESRRGDGEDDKEAWRSFADLRALVAGEQNPFVDFSEVGASTERHVADEFLTLLAVCHTVIPEVRDGKMQYQASSPDEAALVAGAELLGYQFHVRSLSL